MKIRLLLFATLVVTGCSLFSFSPTKLSGQPVKVNGLLNYTFQGPEN